MSCPVHNQLQPAPNCRTGFPGGTNHTITSTPNLPDHIHVTKLQLDSHPPTPPTTPLPHNQPPLPLSFHPHSSRPLSSLLISHHLSPVSFLYPSCKASIGKRARADDSRQFRRSCTHRCNRRAAGGMIEPKRSRPFATYSIYLHPSLYITPPILVASGPPEVACSSPFHDLTGRHS